MSSQHSITSVLPWLPIVASLAAAQAPLLASRPSVLSGNTSTIWPWQIFQSEPNFHPPQFAIDWSGESLEPGVILLEPRNFNGSNATKQVSPLLMNSYGNLVWNGPQLDPTGSYEFDNLRIQSLNGTDYLTYWTGYNQANANSSYGFGNVTFLDKTYDTKYVICPQLGLNVVGGVPHDCDIDLHEQFVTPWGTLLITAYNLTAIDLTSVGGPENGYILDSQIHEIDMSTSESIWKWSALEHIPLNASQLPLYADTNSAANPWDFVHIDSVSTYGENLLVSARHTWDVYAINRTSSNIMWTFNGETGGDWGIVPEEASFRWQYHTRVRAYEDSFIIFSMFVNHNYAAANGTSGSAPTVGREFNLTLPPSKSMSPLTLRTLNESQSLWSDSQGSMEYLPDYGNASSRFLGYGQLPLLREFGVGPGPNTTNLKWQARFGSDNEVSSYRSYKGQWYGEPSYPPKLVVLSNGTAYMSWNGATDVNAWEIYQGSSTNLSLIGTVYNQGFETAVDLGPGCYQVLPVLDSGNGLNSSNVCSY